MVILRDFAQARRGKKRERVLLTSCKTLVARHPELFNRSNVHEKSFKFGGNVTRVGSKFKKRWRLLLQITQIMQSSEAHKS